MLRTHNRSVSKILYAIFFTLLSWVPFSVGAAQSSPKDPTIVFVHGAHLTAASWTKVGLGLKQKGYKSMSVNLPGRDDKTNPKEITLGTSAISLCETVSKVKENVVYVAHSQAGAVVNHALALCPSVNVDSIIYLASVSPLDGEKPFDKLSKQDEEIYYKSVGYDKKTGLMVINDKDVFVKDFSSIEGSVFKEEILSAAVNEPAYIADGVIKLDADTFKAIKKFYIYTENDRIISKASQVAIAKRLATSKTAAIESGHVPMITHSEKLVSLVVDFLTI